MPIKTNTVTKGGEGVCVGVCVGVWVCVWVCGGGGGGGGGWGGVGGGGGSMPNAYRDVLIFFDPMSCGILSTT